MKNQCKTVMALMLSAGVANAAYVTIGNAGNSNDGSGSRNYGGVSYEYKISSTEVSIAEFNASGAGDGDEGYWNEGTRTVGTGAPAVNVSLYEAMKYCNYLTSGNVNDGAYNFSGGTYQSTDRASAITTYGTIYAVPTEDEWYKAAYNVSGNSYSLYADGSGTAPTRGNGETGWSYGGYSVTRDTAHGTSEQNSTVNMMGNVFEWMEDPTGVARGGGYSSFAASMMGSSYRVDSRDASNEDYRVGFRPVELDVVPEPATAGLLMISGLLIAGYRRIQKYYGR